MAFADNNDLLELIPSIFDHNVEDWSKELVRAESDINRKIQSEWYNKRYSGSWDATKLTETQWTLATMYRALSYYILPQLSQWRIDGDSFREQIDFYQGRFAEEIADQFEIGIEYDYDGDGSVDDSEINKVSQDRLWR